MTLTIDYQTEELGNDERFPSEKRLQRWLDTAYEALALSEALELTVRLVDNDEMQELNREANTLGSKSIAAECTQASVELKVLIEQMREQVQNIE